VISNVISNVISGVISGVISDDAAGAEDECLFRVVRAVQTADRVVPHQSHQTCSENRGVDRGGA